MAGDGGRVSDVSEQRADHEQCDTRCVRRAGHTGSHAFSIGDGFAQGVPEAGDGWRTIAVQLAALLRELHPQNPYYREKQAEALAAFDALAGESNEGGNQ